MSKMGLAGAVIMSFFGSLFAAMTLARGFGWSGFALALPFLVFAAIGVAGYPLRVAPRVLPQRPRTDKVILWSSAAEGVGIFVAVNLVNNTGHPEWFLPAVALVVGLHFIPMAWAIPFRPFGVLAAALLMASAAGFAAGGDAGTRISGGAASLVLWSAAVLALRRAKVAQSRHASGSQNVVGGLAPSGSAGGESGEDGQ